MSSVRITASRDETGLKCINTIGSYRCHCPDYFDGIQDDIGGLGFGASGISRINKNLASCRLADECNGMAFGQDNSIDGEVWKDFAG